MSTRNYVDTLTRLKPGELGLLRTHAGYGIDQSSQAFDLFAGIWWPLRQKNKASPRREVAWLVAKLYACYPLPQSYGDTLAWQLSFCQPRAGPERIRFRKRFDRLLAEPMANLEEPLGWALDCIRDNCRSVDWVKLTDDLSIWERETKRLEWAKEFLSEKQQGEV